MEKYNYLKVEINDILEFIKDNQEYYNIDSYSDLENNENLREKLYDDLFIEDSVTGNGSGSYTFNGYTALKYVKENLDLARDSYDNLGQKLTIEDVIENPELVDVTIRTYLLGEALEQALKIFCEKKLLNS